ncbi:3-hydroxyacyl-CoA dehydrogenase family protein [Vallitalea maricola]|uniref:3-hydroxyacyl-CoA dehydrogenase family protein n=1 Tax=Vallitalea maricola TaxID=3074433 RepID=A0ACB5UM27_9FIRM|nr:3-hydroxyacyl-CoA dehydrogenase family protein [Vallitalea sp. AN17-2]
MKTIGVIGAGTMGTGVAHSFALQKYNVILVDISKEILNQAKKNINRAMRFYKYIEKTEIKEPQEVTMGRIQFTEDYQSLADCDLIIENVTENWHVKKEVYKKIDQICKEECIFGVNTSAISITKVGALTHRPDRVIGMHFMNPVPLKKMVEVIKGYHTSQETIITIRELMGDIDKECIVVNDSPGFITNRAMMIFINEAICSLHEQVATAEEIDTLFKTCFGHKMGPLETADLIGIDTILYSLETLYKSYNDPKYRPNILLKKMVDANLLGMKNGKGFYNYV